MKAIDKTARMFGEIEQFTRDDGTVRFHREAMVDSVRGEKQITVWAKNKAPLDCATRAVRGAVMENGSIAWYPYVAALTVSDFDTSEFKDVEDAPAAADTDAPVAG